MFSLFTPDLRALLAFAAFRFIFSLWRVGDPVLPCAALCEGPVSCCGSDEEAVRKGKGPHFTRWKILSPGQKHRRWEGGGCELYLTSAILRAVNSEGSLRPFIIVDTGATYFLSDLLSSTVMTFSFVFHREFLALFFFYNDSLHSKGQINSLLGRLLRCATAVLPGDYLPVLTRFGLIVKISIILPKDCQMLLSCFLLQTCPIRHRSTADAPWNSWNEVHGHLCVC